MLEMELLSNVPAFCFCMDVSLGYDNSDGSSGPAGWHSKATQQLLEPTKLLYQVERKDYNSDPFIKGQRDALSEELKEAERILSLDTVIQSQN